MDPKQSSVERALEMKDTLMEGFGSLNICWFHLDQYDEAKKTYCKELRGLRFTVNTVDIPGSIAGIYVGLDDESTDNYYIPLYGGYVMRFGDDSNAKDDTDNWTHEIQFDTSGKIPEVIIQRKGI